MLHWIRLKDFKSFHDATVQFGEFSLLIGANASGKSNVREALRFIHGIGRGYTFAEILGEKWAEGGQRVWDGLRGGARQVVRHGTDSFELEIEFTASELQARAERQPRRRNYRYGIEVAILDGVARVVSERLFVDGDYVFDTHPDGNARGGQDSVIRARIRKHGRGAPSDGTFILDRPILTQFATNSVATDVTRRSVSAVLNYLQGIRFLDLDPEVARQAAPRGLGQLGGRGENLSAVLEDICDKSESREVLLSWVRSLTPMDASELSFNYDLENRVMALLHEGGGHVTPLATASDGTVRFLAMIASLMSAAEGATLFFEEIENGIHPHRVALLLELIEQAAGVGGPQVIATSHSPQLLVHSLGSSDAIASLVARSEEGYSKIFNLVANEDFSRVLQESDPADLMAAGWMEDTAAFLAEGVA